jgi:hypothetical protein
MGFEREGKRGVTPEFVDMSKEILYTHKFRGYKPYPLIESHPRESGRD